MIRALIDSSAFVGARRSPPEVARRISTACRDGHLALCGPVRLELLRGARSGLDAAELDDALGTMVSLPADDVVWHLARRTLVQLAHLPGDRHREPRVTDIVVAAIAERHEVAVLHDDARFELIAEVTGQRVARVASERAWSMPVSAAPPERTRRSTRQTWETPVTSQEPRRDGH